MPTDPRKRQKRLEKKAARRKDKKHQLVRKESAPLASQFAIAAHGPVIHSAIADSCWHSGIGWALLSRPLPDGRIAMVIFLIDVYCLGVKDVIMEVLSRGAYDVRYRTYIRDKVPMKDYPPAAVRKFVEGAVAYAYDLGLEPHPDYETARIIFGDIDPTSSAEVFEYGKNGVPLFVNGPSDSPARIREVIATLDETCGQGNFHISLIGPAAMELLDE